MNKERKIGFRAHTKILKLGTGRNLDGKKDLREKKEFGSREKRKGSRYLSEKVIWVEPCIYIETSTSIDQEGIEEVSKKNLNRSRGIEEVSMAKLSR